MSDTILIAYATRYGSTQEVAEKIAATLQESGLTVDVQPVKKVEQLERYNAVVIGAPLYMYNWLKEARNFMAQNRTILTRLPVAVFSLGPTENKDEDWKDAQGQLDKVLSNFTWLKPVTVELFGGRFDPTKLTFPYSVIPGLKIMAVSDARDWEAIGAWANQLPEKLIR